MFAIPNFCVPLRLRTLAPQDSTFNTHQMHHIWMALRNKRRIDLPYIYAGTPPPFFFYRPRLLRRMGIAMSLLGKMGLPVKLSSLTDQIFEQVFKDVKSFDDFYVAYLDVCNKFNSALLGQHCEAPDRTTIKGYFTEWQKETDEKKKEELIINKLKEGVKMSQTDHSIMMTGLMVPSAALVLKRTGQGVPQVKKFRLDVVPDFIFVPAVTLAAIFGVKVVARKNLK